MTGPPPAPAAALRAALAADPLVALLRAPRRMAELTLRQWDRVLPLARRANLLGWLALQAERQGLRGRLPAPVQPHLQAALTLIAHQQQAIAWECRHLERALQPLGIPLVLLKGAAYALSGRAAAQGRLFGDVDLLVPREALAAVEAALMLHGWATGKTDPYDQRYYRQWMHELPPMGHQRRGTVVDVHHNILPLTARHVPDATRLLADRVPVPDTALSVLAPCDMVIHSAVHLFHEGDTNNGLRDLRDLDALLGEFAATQPQFWSRLPERAAELGLAWPLLLALRYTDAVLGTPVPQQAMDAVHAAAALGPVRLAALDAVYLRTLASQDRAGEFATAAARGALYLRAHALRMPPALLCLHLGRKAVLRLFKHSSRSAA